MPTLNGKQNELAPVAVPLSVDARKRFLEFVGHVEGAIGPGGDLEPIKGFANKLPEHAARLAAVIALVEDINAPEIGVADLDRGIALAEHYATEQLRVFESSRTNTDLMLAERLLDWMHRSWTEPAISLPDIYQRSLNAISATRLAAAKPSSPSSWIMAISSYARGRRRRRASAGARRGRS